MSKKYIRYGNYAIVDPDMPEEKVIEAYKSVIIEELMEFGVLKIHYNSAIENAEKFGDHFATVGWTLQAPIDGEEDATDESQGNPDSGP